MKEITVKLTIDEVNLILEALGGLPFKQVYGLIGKIEQQAATQLGDNRAVIVPESEASPEHKKLKEEMK